jgi:hypothetical protein
MDADELSQRAADLFHLGWDQGAGAAIWARGVVDELARHEEARARLSDNTADRAVAERFYGSALMLVVAVEQVLAFERRVWRLTQDAELVAARERFDAEVPHAKAIRDIAAHLDAYAVGEGHRQDPNRKRRAGRPLVRDRNVRQLIHWTDEGGTVLQLADEVVNLRAAAHAAVALAEVVERVRLTHLHRTSQEANAALSRKWGIDP